VNEKLIRSVWDRANKRCEYCHMPAGASRGPFHVDHIVARQHGGQTDLNNLALACGYCNRRKGPNIAGRDPETSGIVPLFNPWHDRWADHFEWNGPDLIAKTAIGRTTIQVLAIDHPGLRIIRASLREEGVYDWD